MNFRSYPLLKVFRAVSLRLDLTKNSLTRASVQEEARKMRSSFQCNVRFLRSYKFAISLHLLYQSLLHCYATSLSSDCLTSRMMLNFYGLMIADYATGKLERTDGYKERFLNLNYCSHNNLRISTRSSPLQPRPRRAQLAGMTASHAPSPSLYQAGS